MLESIRFVDLVIPENNWEQKRDDILKYHIDIFTIGNDWNGKFDFLSDICKVVYLDRTPDICSTNIRYDVSNNLAEIGHD
jgi:glycerol-3-phosphate cytidylyltransferase